MGVSAALVQLPHAPRCLYDLPTQGVSLGCWANVCACCCDRCSSCCVTASCASVLSSLSAGLSQDEFAMRKLSAFFCCCCCICAICGYSFCSTSSIATTTAAMCRTNLYPPARGTPGPMSAVSLASRGDRLLTPATSPSPNSSRSAPVAPVSNHAALEQIHWSYDTPSSSFSLPPPPRPCLAARDSGRHDELLRSQFASSDFTLSFLSLASTSSLKLPSSSIGTLPCARLSSRSSLMLPSVLLLLLAPTLLLGPVLELLFVRLLLGRMLVCLSCQASSAPPATGSGAFH